jgi:hypothetical protein
MFVARAVPFRPVLALAAVVLTWPVAAAAENLTCAEIEEFLHRGEIGAQRNIPKGVTLPRRATLEYKGTKHDASIQTVDISKKEFKGATGAELNFRDSWKYNVAGYELAKILELNMVPPYVERSVGGQPASLSWWVNDSMMEIDRYQKKITPPDLDSWNKQMYAVRVLHQLVYDTDTNLTNLLITPDWQLWVIDFSRAFRLFKDVRDRRDLVQCDRRLLARLRTLEKPMLQEKLSRWLTKSEIAAIVDRSQKIVDFFDKEVAAKGEGVVLYDFSRSQQTCGIGL